MDEGTKPIEMEPLWWIEDVMRYLKVSKREVIRLVRDRHLPCSKLGGRTSPLRFRPEAVRAWVIEREHQLEAS